MVSHAQLLSSKGPDAIVWRNAFNRLPDDRKDLFFLPEYAAIYERDGLEAKAFLLNTGCGCVLYPFLLRPVLINGTTACFEGNPTYDLISPYGFGGPVASSDDAAIYREFADAFTAWCLKKRLASEFLCPHPFTGTVNLVTCDPGYKHARGKATVFIDLSGGEGSVWQQLNRGHRSAVNSARKQGVSVSLVTPTAGLYEEFNRLYTETMDRHHAASRWYHPHDYFERCHALLGPERCSFFTARVQGALAAWFIVLHGFNAAYYHFAGSDDNYRRTKASQLLMHEVSLWCQRQGYERLFLGGGVSGQVDDTLLRYKMGFSKNMVEHVTAWRILDRAVYEDLSHQKEAAELLALGQTSSSEFFPAYRR